VVTIALTISIGPEIKLPGEECIQILTIRLIVVHLYSQNHLKSVDQSTEAPAMLEVVFEVSNR
jgi:hypothetical protein